MNFENNTDTAQFGLIVTFAKRLDGLNPRFGKTALQKLVYLAQELQGVPTGYEFEFYNHGPFSSELAGDLDYLNWLDDVDLRAVDDAWGGFVIKPGSKAGETLAEAKDFLERYQNQVDRIIGDFGTMTAKQLELRATVVFVDQDARQHARPLSREELAARVGDLKPQFSGNEILAAIDEILAKKAV
jgi:uncharacterized protein YwgA